MRYNPPPFHSKPPPPLGPCSSLGLVHCRTNHQLHLCPPQTQEPQGAAKREWEFSIMGRDCGDPEAPGQEGVWAGETIHPRWLRTLAHVELLHPKLDFHPAQVLALQPQGKQGFVCSYARSLRRGKRAQFFQILDYPPNEGMHSPSSVSHRGSWRWEVPGRPLGGQGNAWGNPNLPLLSHLSSQSTGSRGQGLPRCPPGSCRAPSWVTESSSPSTLYQDESLADLCLPQCSVSNFMGCISGVIGSRCLQNATAARRKPRGKALVARTGARGSFFISKPWLRGRGRYLLSPPCSGLCRSKWFPLLIFHFIPFHLHLSLIIFHFPH